MIKLCLVILATMIPIADAQLVITEVMAKSSHSESVHDGDWWELTNIGASAVDLSGYTWDDTPTPELPTISHFPEVSIAAGETIVILQENLDNVTAWRSAWGLTTATRVLPKDTFIGGESFSSFARSGDEINLYDPDGARVAHVEFGESIKGKSQAYLRDGSAIYLLNSQPGKHAAVASTKNPSDHASPGDAGLHFVTVPEIYAITSYSSLFAAEKTGSPTATFSATSVPSFLTLTPGAAGSATLTNNRVLGLADAGNYVVQVTATSGGKSSMQEYVLTILNPSPTLILNEYNAVSSQNFLNGGTELADDDGGELSQDSHFGRVAGNGGQWVEFVVVGNGSAGTVDLRGWVIEIGKNKGFGFEVLNTMALSNHADWQAVPSGTILTFIEKNSAQGGLDSGFARRDRRDTLGDTWSNLWIGDPAYLNYTSQAVNGYKLIAGLVTGVDIDNDGTQFRIKDAAGQVVSGPVGEGVAPLSGTSSREVFELENHPTPAISPIVATTNSIQGYDDGASSSTFGWPNDWMEVATPVTQDYSPYAVSAFDLWASSYELSGDSAKNTADPDKDGRDNFSEYAFGGNPTHADAAYPSGGLGISTVMEWSYVRRANDPTLVFSYESSPDLLLWDDLIASSTSKSPFSADSDFETVTVEFAKPVPMPSQWFLRTKAK